MKKINSFRHNIVQVYILYTKKKCHLCDEIKGVLNKVRKDFEFEFEEINIETDKVLLEKYKEKISSINSDWKDVCEV